MGNTIHAMKLWETQTISIRREETSGHYILIDRSVARF
jgi:hypothetical protein